MNSIYKEKLKTVTPEDLRKEDGFYARKLKYRYHSEHKAFCPKTNDKVKKDLRNKIWRQAEQEIMNSDIALVPAPEEHQDSEFYYFKITLYEIEMFSYVMEAI